MVVNRVPPSPLRRVRGFQMLQARNDWPEEHSGAEVVAFPRSAPDEDREFGRRGPRKQFSLLVDLHSEEIGPRWFRGAATLAALC